MNKFTTIFLAGLLSIGLYAKEFATVNGVSITDEDISMIIRNPQIQFSTLPEKTQKQVIEQAVERKLLALNAKESGIQSTPEFKNAVEKIKDDLALEFWMQKEFKSINVKYSQIKKFYNENIAQFKKAESAKARHILVKTEAEAKDIIKELNSSKEVLSKFIELAKTKSTGPSGTNGGDLGWFEAKRMVPEFSKATFKLSTNSYTKTPVKTQFGYHIIYLEDKKPASTIPLADIKMKIENQLKSTKFKNRVEELAKELKRKATISYK